MCRINSVIPSVACTRITMMICIVHIVNNHSWMRAKCLSGYSNALDETCGGEVINICAWLVRHIMVDYSPRPSNHDVPWMHITRGMVISAIVTKTIPFHLPKTCPPSRYKNTTTKVPRNVLSLPNTCPPSR